MTSMPMDVAVWLALGLVLIAWCLIALACRAHAALVAWRQRRTFEPIPKAKVLS